MNESGPNGIEKVEMPVIEDHPPITFESIEKRFKKAGMGDIWWIDVEWMINTIRRLREALLEERRG